MAKKNMKKQTVSQERVRRSYQTRFDPIKNLTPPRLVDMQEAFRRGYLAETARTWEAIRERDPQCASVIPKREKSLRYGLDYVYSEGSEKERAAQDHMKALKYFYENLRCVNVLDQNQRGGAPLLIRTMMSSVGFRYAAHEIVWDPRGQRELTATMYACPLSFFENTTGRLRYLENEGNINGIDLEEGQWITTVGDGLMHATATAYMYKNLSLRDLLNYCERYAIPGLHGKTDAQPGSEEWETVVSALHNFAIDLAMVTSSDASIDKIDASAVGTLPHPALIEYMDKAITLVWRGGDLSTLSGKTDSVGSNIQQDELDILEQDDAQVITDTLNEQVDRWVIRYLFNEDPLCWVKVRTAQRDDVEQDIKIDSFLGGRGFPQSVEDFASRYSRTVPDSKNTLLPPPAPETPGMPDYGLTQPWARYPGVSLSNAAPAAPHGRDLLSAALTELARAQSTALRPLADELMALYRRAEAEDMSPEQIAKELARVRETLPDLLFQMSEDPKTTEIFADMQAAAWANGIEEGAL